MWQLPDWLSWNCSWFVDDMVVLNVSQEDSCDFDSHLRTSWLVVIWTHPHSNEMCIERLLVLLLCLESIPEVLECSTVLTGRKDGRMGLYLRTGGHIKITVSGLVGLESAQAANQAFALHIFLLWHMMKGHMITSVSCLSGISQDITTISFAQGDFFSKMGITSWGTVEMKKAVWWRSEVARKHKCFVIQKK